MKVRIGGAYNGPADSANGGYACGVFAGLAAYSEATPPAVTLHAPPPLGTDLEVRAGARRTQVWHGERLIATIGPEAGKVDEIEPVTVAEAEQAEAGFAGREGHPFPTCFVCGVEREPSGGFPVTPGKVDGRDLVACTWTPEAGDDGEVPSALVWSVLDCPGGWTGDPVREPMVLGRMSAIVHKRPSPGRAHVIVGRLRRRHGRTANVGTALYDDTGRLLAQAASVWIALDSGKREKKG
ncbi:hypothetical protein [Amycolatopsis sp. NPDC057786]|uniref:hypothetical protein n=1 Tax=Amycolatopsis sp. NPDC057786 TaxID=3346250 RepID=UPI00366FCE0F